jgi:hypothetical protein
MDSKLRAATLTIYYHAYGLNEAAAPPMGLTEAVVELRKGGHARDEGRRRRVVAKLVGAGLDRFDEYRAALDRLHPHFAGTSWDSLIPGLREMTRFVAETAVINKLAEVLGVVGCNRTWPNTETGRNPGTQETWVQVSIRVARPLIDLARVVDPQNWDQGSVYFVAAHVPERTLAGTVTIDPFTHYAPQHTNPPKPGTVWQDLFFEHFESYLPIPSIGVSLASFFNLLAVDARYPDAQTFHMKYSLAQSIWSRIGLSEMAGGLDVDQGFGEARLDPDNWVTVTGKKTLRFTARPWFPTLHLWLNNGGAEVALQAMGEEFYEAVCS